MISKKFKAYVVAVDMGYGHQRAADPLKKYAVGGVINANSYSGIPQSDRKIWKNSRQFYEKISQLKSLPLIGDKLWRVYDHFQKIPPFYPKRDLSAPNIQLKSMYQLIKKQNWGRDLIEKLDKKPLPLITTFFATAFMAEEFGYRQEIYCVACDADISRSWAPLKPSLSRIKYITPTKRVAERLKQYGVRSENIYEFGFPLPKLLTSSVKKDLARRILALDPMGKFRSHYNDLVVENLGKIKKVKTPKPVRIMFAVGGAGAQREIGAEIITSLRELIKNNKIQLTLVAGIHNEVASFFKNSLRKNGLVGLLGKGVNIISATSKDEYFDKFNKEFKRCDILWTKPSELSFYSELGMPIIIAPPIGSQEDFNASWLLKMGAGIMQYDPRFTHQWLVDWLNNGWLAEAAMQGYIEGDRGGLVAIEKLLN